MSPLPPISIASVHQPAFLFTADGRCAAANSLAESLAGRPLTGCLPRDLVEIFHLSGPNGSPFAPADLPCCRTLGGEEFAELEIRITSHDGRTHTIQSVASPVHDGGVIVGVLDVWHDVTERAAEQDERSFVALLFDQMTDGAIATDRELRVTAWNRAAERLFGWTATEAMGRSIRELVGDVVTEAEWQAWLARLERGETVPHVFHHHLPDGRTVIAEGSVAPILEPSGSLIGYISVYRDTTEQERLETELSESEAKYRNLVELSPDAILIHQDGLIVFANAAALALLGAEGPALLLGRPVIEFVHPSSRREVKMNISADLRGEESPISAIEMVRLDGTTVTTQGRGAMIPFGGRPALQVVLRDVTEVKRAEAALDASEERLRLAQECGGIGVWEYAPPPGNPLGPGGLLRVFDSGLSIITESGEWQTMVHPDDLEGFEATMEAALALGEHLELEFRLIRHPGSERWVRILGKGIYDEAGRLQRVLGVHLEITDEKRFEALLLERERRKAFLLALGDRLRDLADVRAVSAAAVEMTGQYLDASGAAYFEVDAAGEQTTVQGEWNDETVRGLGSIQWLDDFGAGEIYRKGLVRRTEDVMVGYDQDQVARHRALGVRAVLGVPILRGGRLAAILSVYSSSPRAWTDTEVDLVREVAERTWDAVGRARAEKALRKRERTMASLFRAAPVGIGMVSHRTIVQANDQLCRMTGYDREELLGRDIRMLYPSDEAYTVTGEKKHAQIVESGIGVVESQWQRKDGTIIEIVLSSSPVDLSHPLENVVFNALDVTRLRESERAIASYMDDLRRSNEELQRFAYVASHDLQEPLRSIISFSQLLERRYKGTLDADADEFIGFIVDGGLRMQQLIQDLLQLSRVETTAAPLAPTDAGEVVADALRLLETPIREAGATVEVGALPTVMADAAQLGQVFSNLVGNAIKYRREGVPPVVRVSAEREGRSWRFSVADNGIGIEAEYFDRIFVIFQRLHTRDEYPGTGIGLAVVRRIVERHGGRTRVESSPGEGSTFSFTLPVV